MKRYCTVLLAMATFTGFCDVTVVERPDTTQPNPYYTGNRAPLVPSPFIKLPVGAVAPGGWLRKQLELQSAGFHGHLTEISRFLKKENNAWLSASGAGQAGWEEVPYWLKGFGDCAYLLGHEEQIKEARLWIEAAIKSQREDGFFGPRPGVKATVSSTSGQYDLWPNMVMLMGLQSYYEFTKDQRVIDLMTKYFRWQLSVPERDFLPPYWQQQRAGDNLFSVYWLYNITGEEWLLKLAEKVYRHTANWTDGIPDWHNVNMSQAFGGPTYYWMQSRDPKHLQASGRNWQTMRAMYGQVPGGMFGGDENCRPGYTDPRQAVETCGMVEMMFSHERLLGVTGDPIWADRCEDVAFNSLPAALLADMKSLRYLTSPNMVVSDRRSKAPGLQNGGPMLHFDPHNHRCCQHNYGHGWPYFAEYLWMATPGNGVAAVMYSESQVKAKVGDGEEVTISERTHYPFDENITFKITSTKKVSFPLYLRVPGWCEQATLKINGKQEKVAIRRLSYIRIQREWSNGDTVELGLPMKVSLRKWEKNNNSVSVDRGPLSYSLKIGEKYVRAGGTEKWPGWEVMPTTAWNYGLVLGTGNPEGPFEVVQKAWPESNLPFTHEGAPIELSVKAKQIPEWQLDRHGLAAVLQASPVKSAEPVDTVTLIPMGSARLRVAAFPVIAEGEGGHVWKSPTAGRLLYKASASHTHESDTTDAMHDQEIPKDSNDHAISRFTFWPHKGTTEWVQYEFPKAKSISGVQVYWFDDAPGGGCRLPAAWRVLYLAGNEWKEVPGLKVEPVSRDKFNNANFEAVETTAVKLEVQLKAGFSGGILEWKVE